VLIRNSFYGKTTSTSNGTIIEDSAYPIYVGDNGNGTWNYLIYPNGYSYYNLFLNSTTDPANLANGLSTDITTGNLTYDLVAPTSDNVVVDGVNYPSDQSDVHYLTGFNYIDFGVDASLNGFLGKGAGDWSYGGRLQRAIPRDGLGRVMFTREGRTWQGFYIGHSDTYSNMIFGNGSSLTYDSSEVTPIPANGFAVGSYIRCTYVGSTFSIYVDGVKYYDYSISSYVDNASSSDSLNLTFGNGVVSNTYQTNTSYVHGLWQGAIDRLWISANTAVSTDDNGTTFPTNTTHSWLLDETTGKDFVANTGGVNGVGAKISL